MILKLSDLQRSLDYSLATTHGQYRVYMIIGEYCAEASECSARVVLTYPQYGRQLLATLSVSGRRMACLYAF
jgi:aarF domain-containing kinase